VITRSALKSSQTLGSTMRAPLSTMSISRTSFMPAAAASMPNAYAVLAAAASVAGTETHVSGLACTPCAAIKQDRPNKKWHVRPLSVRGTPG
jgi:hypothetical protein